MPIVNYLWWMWCLFECGTWLWPKQINWLFVAALPSVTLGKRAICRVPWKIHSAKRDKWQKSVNSGTKMPSLSSVCAVTLDKEANICTFWASLCRVSSIWHSTKMTSLPSVRDLTLSKDSRLVECPGFDTWQIRHVCRVSDIGHSAKNSGLPSVRSGTLGKRVVTVSAPSRYFFSSSVGFSSRQSICWVPDRKHSAKRCLPTP